MRGEKEKARGYYAGAISFYEKTLAERPDDLDAWSNLSLAYAALGQKENAVSEAKGAVELVPLSRDALDAPVQMLVLAEVYAQVGEGAAALELLAKVVELPGGPDYGQLKFDPIWDGIRRDPRFAQIMSRAAQPPRWN
jgi:tetratricopeptide (TPR) repeat protein